MKKSSFAGRRGTRYIIFRFLGQSGKSHNRRILQLRYIYIYSEDRISVMYRSRMKKERIFWETFSFFQFLYIFHFKYYQKSIMLLPNVSWQSLLSRQRVWGSSVNTRVTVSGIWINTASPLWLPSRTDQCSTTWAIPFATNTDLYYWQPNCE